MRAIEWIETDPFAIFFSLISTHFLKILEYVFVRYACVCVCACCNVYKTFKYLLVWLDSNSHWWMKEWDRRVYVCARVFTILVKRHITHTHTYWDAGLHQDWICFWFRHLNWQCCCCCCCCRTRRRCHIVIISFLKTRDKFIEGISRGAHHKACIFLADIIYVTWYFFSLCIENYLNALFSLSKILAFLRYSLSLILSFSFTQYRHLEI